MDIAWFQSRYDKAGPGGTGADYINCPLDQGRSTRPSSTRCSPARRPSSRNGKNTPYFDGCLPIEVMAERGRETLRHGPMKPIGLTNPHKPARVKAYAVVQLRQDNALGTLYNMVGFQTKLKHAEQVGIFRMIPGLENAEFARLGGLHRNTYLNSPRLLDPHAAPQGDAAPALRRADHRLRGLCRKRRHRPPGRSLRRRRTAWARHRAAAATTALGALLNHITGGHIETIDAGPRSFQPMNVNFGLFPPIEAAPRGEDGKRLAGTDKAVAAQARLDRPRQGRSRGVAARSGEVAAESFDAESRRG